MRDPRVGFEVVQALAPAAYTGAGYITGPELDLSGFSSAIFLVSVQMNSPVAARPKIKLQGIDLENRTNVIIHAYTDVEDICFHTGARLMGIGEDFNYSTGEFERVIEYGSSGVFMIGCRKSYRNMRVALWPSSGCSVGVLLLKGHPLNRV
jgi:hypothetical protein